MKLIVGLGNPGKEYEGTRHNIGFSVVDYYIEKKGFSGIWKKGFDSLGFETNIGGEKVWFIKPQSFMNKSGGPVASLVNYYKLSVDDILVISDDLDLMVGNFKLRERGSCGGHNGLRDIGRCLGTDEYKRLKVGIANDKEKDTRDYVLGKFSKDDINTYKNLYDELVNVLDDYFVIPFGDLMSRYNRKNR